jgi:hypothetical protein
MRANLFLVLLVCAVPTPWGVSQETVSPPEASARQNGDATEWVVPQAMASSEAESTPSSSGFYVTVEDDSEQVLPTPTTVLTGVKEHIIGRPRPLPVLTEFQGYKTEGNWSEWMVGNGDQFGDFSFGDDCYQPGGVDSGLGLGFAVHFLSGPDQTDMPPRLYNFLAGYQKREKLGDFAYDVSVGVNAASDFEGSSRKGIRFPAHAVGYVALTENLDVVLGADFLDRADIHWLPVAGFVWCPLSDLRLELVFPQPRVDFQLNEEYRLYLAGGLGGGTWAVERDSEVDDLVSYRDLRAAVGLEHATETSGWHAYEIAVLFDRDLEYTSGVGDYSPNPTVLVRSVSRF